MDEGSLDANDRRGRRIGSRREGQMAHLALSLLSKKPESGDVLLLRGLSQSSLAHSVWLEDSSSSSPLESMDTGWRS
jgi:hypothetical protein